jgi:eukaryotic translation initiation factor 2-alpha kinase 3
MYAVKKVPLSATRLQRIQRRGQAELEDVLREIRTLARLDHPNIVRYFGGWIEWVDGTSPAAVVENISEDNAVTGADDVVFEDSSHFSAARLMQMPSQPSPSIDGSSLRRVGTRSSNNASVSDNDDSTETVDRTFDPSLSVQSGASNIAFAEPTLALHMQMSLHPMTLADFLSPAGGASSLTPNLEHCYHIPPSLSIMHAILDGIEYLHNEGIAHRDIKPANIFLGPQNNLRATSGSIDLMLCHECREQHTANPIRLEVRIGDFGLVAVAESDVQQAVGTEIYRPLESTETSSSSLDVYASGIVAFELLRKFDTKMERHQTIQKLKEEGEFPPGFCSKDEIKQCIKAMLNGATIQEAKRAIIDLKK